MLKLSVFVLKVRVLYTQHAHKFAKNGFDLHRKHTS